MFYVELDVFSKFPELFLLFMFLFHNRGLCSIFDIKIGCKILFISITLQVLQISGGCGDQSDVVLRIFHHNETSITIKQKCIIYLKYPLLGAQYQWFLHNLAKVTFNKISSNLFHEKVNC